jgi:hypothetical protein
MLRRFLSLFLAALVGTALASTPLRAGETNYVVTIIKEAKGNLTVRFADGKEFTAFISKQAMVTLNGNPCGLDQLANGQKAAVTIVNSGGKNSVFLKVLAKGDPPDPAKKVPAKKPAPTRDMPKKDAAKKDAPKKDAKKDAPKKDAKKDASKKDTKKKDPPKEPPAKS